MVDSYCSFLKESSSFVSDTYNSFAAQDALVQLEDGGTLDATSKLLSGWRSVADVTIFEATRRGGGSASLVHEAGVGV